MSLTAAMKAHEMALLHHKETGKHLAAMGESLQSHMQTMAQGQDAGSPMPPGTPGSPVKGPPTAVAAGAAGRKT